MPDATHPRSAERLFSGYTGRISTLLALGWLATLWGRQALSPLLPTIIETLSIRPSQAGFALTLMMGLYAVLQYPGGRLSDGLSRTTVVAAGLAVMVVGFGLLTRVATYAGLLLGVSLVGVGAGLFFSPGRALLSDLFVERRGQAFGVQTAAGMIGGMLAAGTAAAVLVIATWRVAFLAPILLLVLVLLLLHRWSREPYVVGRVDLEIVSTGARLLASRRLRWLLVGYTLFGIFLQAFVGFLPTFLELERGLSSTHASAGFALVYVVGVVVGPAAGGLSDRFPRGRVVIGALSLCALGLVVLLLASGLPAIALGIVITATGTWAYIPTVGAYLMDTLPNEHLGGDFGGLKTVYSGLASVGPTYVGFVAERLSYAAAFAGLVFVLVAAIVVLSAAMRLE